METGDLSPPGASFLGLLAVTLGALLAAGIAFRRAARLRREGSAVQLLSRLPHGPCKARSGFEEGAQKGLLFRACRPKQPKHPSSVPSNPLERIQHPLYDARCVAFFLRLGFIKFILAIMLLMERERQLERPSNAQTASKPQSQTSAPTAKQSPRPMESESE